MATYKELKEKQPVLEECFFAFSEKQLQEGIEKHKLQGKKLYNAGGGMIGTKEGIQKFHDFHEQLRLEIAKECNPQEIYDYEFVNHECDYTHDDSEAFEIVVYYFGIEKAAEVTRKRGYVHTKITE